MIIFYTPINGVSLSCLLRFVSWHKKGLNYPCTQLEFIRDFQCLLNLEKLKRSTFKYMWYKNVIRNDIFRNLFFYFGSTWNKCARIKRFVIFLSRPCNFILIYKNSIYTFYNFYFHLFLFFLLCFIQQMISLVPHSGKQIYP